MDQDHCTLEQAFGGEAADAYTKLGLFGHPGRDTSCGYGSDIHSPVSGVVCGVFTPEHPASDGYVAVYILVTTKLETFEYCIGHMSQVLVKVGDQVKKGDLLGKEGNKGYVFANGVQITLAMQAAGDRRGSHRHNQKRVVYEIQFTGQGTYLENAKGLVTSPRNWFYVWALPHNGYNSCVDFSLPLFNRDLQQGDTGYDVRLLQKALGVDQTGNYGPKTLAAVQDFQLAHALSPALGVCGPQTRALLNSLYGQLEDPQEPVQPPVQAPAPVVTPQVVAQATEALAGIQSLPVAYQPDLLSRLMAWISAFLKK